MVVLAQPFVSLKQQTAADMLKENCVTKLNGSPLRDLAAEKGILLLSSFESLHCNVNVARQAVAEGLNLVLCTDEVHTLRESVTATENSGYRAFQAMWTFMASLADLKFLFFAMSATVRPKNERFLAQELGIETFSEVLRVSPTRPEVLLDKFVCVDKEAALLLLLQTRPQMVSGWTNQFLYGALIVLIHSQILVMTKNAGCQLQEELKSRGLDCEFFYSGMDSSDKEAIMLRVGKACVIATTGKAHPYILMCTHRYFAAGFITGLNSLELERSVVWEYTYNFENLVQFMVCDLLKNIRGFLGGV
jgi:hypothetical protein